MGLEAETFTRKKEMPQSLVLGDLEREYFTGEPVDVQTRSGKWTNNWINCQRVELNALSADPHRFIKWVESKLEQHGVKKIVPPKKAVLRSAREQRDSLLDSAVREEFDRQLNVDALVREITGRLSSQVLLDDMPSMLRE